MVTPPENSTEYMKGKARLSSSLIAAVPKLIVTMVIKLLIGN